MSIDSDYKELIKAHNGDMALLYIYMNSCKTYDRNEAAIALSMTMQQIEVAEEKLGRAGLMETNGDVLILPAADIDTLLAFPIRGLALYYLYLKRRGTLDVKKAAADLQMPEAQIEDLKNKLSILHLLPNDAPAVRQEIPVENFPQCKKDDEPNPDKQPDSEHPATVKDPAPAPAEPGDEKAEPVPPVEKVMAGERKDFDRKELIRLFAVEVGIYDRPLTPLERKYFSDWIDLGFRDPKAVAIAYERTVRNMGKMKWEYANSIMKSWYTQKLFTPEDILEFDKRHRSTSKKSQERETERAARRKQPDAAQSSGVTEEDYDVEKWLKQMRGGGKTGDAGKEKKQKTAQAGTIDLEALKSLRGQL